MEFKEAFEKVSLGKKIRRRGWIDKSIYFVMTPEKDLIGYRQEVVSFSFNINLANTHDWMLVDEKSEDILSFPEAVYMLSIGKKIRSKSWDDDSFIQISENRKEIYLKRTCEYNFQPEFECLSSNDWEVIDG